jgi:hypothetical protein
MIKVGVIIHTKMDFPRLSTRGAFTVSIKSIISNFVILFTCSTRLFHIHRYSYGTRINKISRPIGVVEVKTEHVYLFKY